jgi:peroxiredoxin
MHISSFFTVIGSTFIFFACQPAEQGKPKAMPIDSTFTLTGKIVGFDTGWIYLKHRQSPDNSVDSARINNGQFVFTGKATIPEFCNIGALRQGKKDYYFGFFLQNGVQTLRANKDSLSDAAVVIDGSSVAKEFRNFQISEKFIDSTEKHLDAAYEETKSKNNKTEMANIIKQYEDLNERQKQIAESYAKQHPSSYISAFEIYSNFFFNPDPGKLDSIYKRLDSAIEYSYYGKKIKKVLESAEKTAIGQSAPDFVMNDSKGKSISLSSFKGKYLLVDFWASWCGPCRQENPAVVKAYHRFHSKGLEILGVSLDQEKDSWLGAIKKDQLNWTQVSDLKGWENIASKEYGVQAIPMNFLLDQEGRIIGKDLRGKDLEKKLSASIPQ